MSSAINSTTAYASAYSNVGVTVDQTIAMTGHGKKGSAANIADITATANGGNADVTVNQTIYEKGHMKGSASNFADVTATANGGNADVTINQTIYERGKVKGTATNTADVTATANGGNTSVTVNQNVIQLKGKPPEFLQYAHGKKF